MKYSLHIAYGSEYGNAHGLAYNLKREFSQFKPKYCELNELNIHDLSTDDLLLVITSTTGDGDAPSNANSFYRKLIQTKNPLTFSFAVFGLGDVNYDNFCGFSKVVDGLFSQKGATAITSRVDADIDYEAFFDIWTKAIKNYLLNTLGSQEKLAQLHLQIDPNE